MKLRLQAGLSRLLWSRFDNTQQELSKAVAQNKELQREMERLQSEVTRLKTQQLKASKDGEKFKQERDSVISEYRLIMSERDQVIKEVDRLQTGLEMAEAKLKNTSSERRVANEELEALRQVRPFMEKKKRFNLFFFSHQHVFCSSVT